MSGTQILGLYYDDVEIDAELTTTSHVIAYKDVLAFADITLDHHPLHTDPDYCRNTEFGQPIAHGLYGLALIEGLKSELRLYQNTAVASLGWDKVQFKKPIISGDTVHVRMTFTHKRPSRKPDRGVFTEKLLLVNLWGDVVTEAEHVTLLKRRVEDARTD